MKTVLNKKNIDQLRNPMFLGEDLSLQRYDQIKYPKFYDLYDQQLNFFWRPQEVSLVKDISDYKNLSPEERFVFDSNLKFQTMTDSMLSRSIHELMKHCTNSELEICMNAFSMYHLLVVSTLDIVERWRVTVRLLSLSVEMKIFTLLLPRTL